MKKSGFFLVLLVVAASVAVFYFRDSLVVDLMQGLADWLFQLFEDDAFPLFLAAVILVVALAMWLGYLLFIIFPKTSSLHRLRKAVLEYPDEKAFTGDINNISQRLSDSSLIGHAWREFRETLVEPKGETGVVQNTTRPHVFINFSCAQEKSLALRMMPHIPNYFVGIGLLLTFVGLVAALFFANNSIGGDASEAVEGLRDLLAAATFKFWTSIAGLLSSIVLSFFFRLYALWLEDEFGKLCTALERRMEFATPQRIFVDVRDTIEEQLVETKKINTEIAMSIADGVSEVFRKQVPGMLSDAMKPLVDAVQESSDKVREGATGGLENLVNQFAQTMEGSASQHLTNMSETLSELTRSLEKMQGSMDSSGAEFARRMAEGSENLDATMRELATPIRSLVEGLRAQVNEVSQAFGSSLQESLDRLSRQSEEMASRLTMQSRNASSAFSEEISKAAQSLSAAANENAESSTELARQLRESLGSSVEGVQGALDRVVESLSSLQSGLARQGREMSVVAEQSQTVARSMENASSAINEGFEPFQRIGQSLNESSNRLERSVLSMAEKIDGAVATIGTVSTDLSKVSETLASAWESYRSRFERVDEDLESVFTKLQGAVENQQRNVQTFVKELDGSFEKALSGLSGGIDGINTTVEDLLEVLEKTDDSRRPEQVN